MLKNPWGMSFLPTTPFWISNQGANTSTLYTVNTVTGGVSKVNIPPNGFVAIPTTATGPQGPGQDGNVNNSSFDVSTGSCGKRAAAHLIFANLNRTISARITGATSFT